MTRARFVGVLLLALVCACSRKGKRDDAPELPPAPAVPKVDGGVSFGQAASGPPRALAAALREKEVLTVDRRFVLAFAHVDRIMGRPTATYEAKLGADDKWTIIGGSVTVATDLARFPDYGPLMDALTRHAAKGLKTPSPLRAGGPIEIPVGSAALADLARADHTWATPAERPKAARTAAIALVGALFGSEDLLDVADDIGARAIAAMAIAKAHGVEIAAVEAVLARVLGYGVAAKQIAPADEADAAAAYAAFDDARLFKLAKRSAFGRLAWLRRLVIKGDDAGTKAWLDRDQVTTRWSLEVLNRTARMSGGLETARAFERSYAAIVLLNVLLAGSDAADPKIAKARAARDARSGVDGPGDAILAALGVERKDLLIEYEKAMAKLAPQSGVFRDELLERDLFDAAMMSAMTLVHDYYGDALSSPEETVRQSQLLVASDGPRTKAFAPWFATMAASRSKASPLEVVKHVTAPSVLGSNARWRILRRVRDRLDEIVARDFARAYLAYTDTRPSEVYNHAIDNARDGLLDPTQREMLVRSVVARMGEPGAQSEAWLLRIERQRDPIIAFSKRTNISPEARARLITWAAGAGVVDDVALDDAAKSLLAEAPNEWAIHEAFIEAFQTKHRERARAIAQGWIDRRAGAAYGPLGDVAARIKLASLLKAEKKYDEALVVLEPAIATWQGDALTWGAMMHARAGRYREAERIAQQAWKRYPQSTGATITVAKVRWLAGDMKGAADAFVKSPRSVAPDWTLGGEFAGVFSDRPDAAADAVEALRAAGLKQFPIGIASYLLEHDNAPLALVVIFPQTQRGVFMADKPSPYAFDPGEKVLAYHALTRTKGKAEALKWLGANLTDPTDMDLAFYAALEQRVDGVFELVKDSDSADRWAVRIASEVRRMGKVASADKARAAFKRDVKNRYATYGSYLLGDVDANAIEAHAISPKQTCEVAFFLALRAQAEGRHRDAIALLRVALDTRSTRDAEYKWAQTNLKDYLLMNRPIDSLEPGYPDWKRFANEL